MGSGPWAGVLCMSSTPPPFSRKLQHRNLVRLLGVILHQGLYIVMEHVSKVPAWGSQVGRWGWAVRGGQPATPPCLLSPTGQSGELPTHPGPGPREHHPALTVFSVSVAPHRDVGFQGQGETEARGRKPD